MAEHVCPVWIGYLLASPLRKLIQNPRKILAPYVQKGMTVLDIGCAMGFFSLPMARLVGAEGKVICVDLQEKMLTSLKQRAAKARLTDRIETRLCPKDALGIDDLAQRIDFALAFALVHEVPDAKKLFSEIHTALKPSGKLMIAEPMGRVPEEHFNTSLAGAQQNGFKIIDRPSISRAHAALLLKP
jgi:ubiquinone/menaquinone biosynthesis C-methylase UbiE